MHQRKKLLLHKYEINKLLGKIIRRGGEYLILFDCSTQTTADAIVIPEIATYSSGRSLRKGPDVIVSDGLTEVRPAPIPQQPLTQLTVGNAQYRVQLSESFYNHANEIIDEYHVKSLEWGEIFEVSEKIIASLRLLSIENIAERLFFLLY